MQTGDSCSGRDCRFVAAAFYMGSLERVGHQNRHANACEQIVEGCVLHLILAMHSAAASDEEGQARVSILHKPCVLPFISW